MSALTLYTNPQSRGRIARWMLEEIGQPYDTQVLEYGGSIKSAEFLAINPMGKVPTLVHGDQVVTEAAAICAYLAQAFPDAGLAPRADEMGAYFRWLFFTAGPMEAAITDKMVFGVETPADKLQMVGYGSYQQVIDALAGALQKTPYIAGERFTAADVYVGAQVGWGLTFGTLEKRPAFEAYAARISERPAFRRATEMDEALVSPG
ncbi:glutathione S-transferase domain-containing protein [Alcanivorax hongdengensis A-11-3]|uniref:Glutathione S-transferase domain-containing protein n=1 Tax=Alcanivorax hongdengensis A-11-3 TaxID=1177179 RepID=L0W8W1_9GAMM|nr:glutathione S-transferase family protein [Alcanivorax hongdengensis]EKF73173.1 glutathione S-transferase domain-containing protein [Alcanivorax hongdengensis A-11-3]